MSDDFKSLQAKWYKKLADEGFKDIEKEAQSLSGRFKSKQVEQIQDYYDKASSFLNDYDFRNLKHKRIWDLHTQGLSTRKIAAIAKFSKSDVHRIIKKYESIMLGAY